jgi:hypothetical protein
LVGEAISSPRVLHYLETHFLPNIMEKTLGWVISGKAIPLRYEDLKTRSISTLRELTDRITPVEEASIVAALKLSEIEKMRAKSDFLKLHCRDGSIGQWKRELGEPHFEIFRRTWAPQFILLGYSVD